MIIKQKQFNKKLQSLFPISKKEYIGVVFNRLLQNVENEIMLYSEYEMAYMAIEDTGIRDLCIVFSNIAEHYTYDIMRK